MSLFASTWRWLERKRYQYEVTFSLYMLTPTEKFIFNLFILSFFSMIAIAVYLYFPHHINFIVSRAWFYYNGEDAETKAMAPTAIDAATTTAKAVIETAKAAAEEIRQAVTEREL